MTIGQRIGMDTLANVFVAFCLDHI